MTSGAILLCHDVSVMKFHLRSMSGEGTIAEKTVSIANIFRLVLGTFIFLYSLILEIGMRVTPPHPASLMTSLCWKCQRRLTWTSTPRCVSLRPPTLTLSMARVPGCMAGAQHPVEDPHQLHSLRRVSLYSQRMRNILTNITLGECPSGDP